MLKAETSKQAQEDLAVQAARRRQEQERRRQEEGDGLLAAVSGMICHPLSTRDVLLCQLFDNISSCNIKGCKGRYLSRRKSVNQLAHKAAYYPDISCRNASKPSNRIACASFVCCAW